MIWLVLGLAIGVVAYLWMRRRTTEHPDRPGGVSRDTWEHLLGIFRGDAAQARRALAGELRRNARATDEVAAQRVIKSYERDNR